MEGFADICCMRRRFLLDDGMPLTGDGASQAGAARYTDSCLMTSGLIGDADFGLYIFFVDVSGRVAVMIACRVSMTSISLTGFELLIMVTGAMVLHSDYGFTVSGELLEPTRLCRTSSIPDELGNNSVTRHLGRELAELTRHISNCSR